MKYIVKRDDEVLDLIVYNQYGSIHGNLEVVLNINKHIFDDLVFLQIGTEIELPEIDNIAKIRTALWE